jgi:hypothetical protein
MALHFLNLCSNLFSIGVPSDVVPATYKKKKAAPVAAKAVDGDEKATAGEGEAAEETPGAGRGTRE